MGAEVTIPGRISSDITLVSAVRTAAVPTAHLFIPCLEYRVVSVMCGELGIEKGQLFLKGARHPRRLCPVEPRNIYTSAAAILYAGLTAGVLGEEGCL